MSASEVSTPHAYTSFWPLQIFLTVIGIWIIYQLVELNVQRIDTQQAIAQLLPQGQAALQAKQKLVDLAKDLKQTASKDSAAAQIVNEFRIQLENPATPPTPTSNEK